jgi:hypothetical protein
MEWLQSQANQTFKRSEVQFKISKLFGLTL